MPKIFISHAHKDETLVTEFVDTILVLGCGVPRDEIFCTSYPDKGITEGKNFINEIEKNLKTASLVILMISPNYYESQFCLGELGATWLLQSDSKDDSEGVIFPLVINLSFDKVKALLQVTHMGMIDNKSNLNRLHDRVVKKLNINARTDDWDRKCTEFLKLLPDLLKGLKKPTTIPYTDYEKLQQEVEEKNKQLNQRAIEIERLLEQITRLEKAKDKEEVEKIKAEFSTESEEEQKFNRLLEASVDALRDLPETVDNVMYEHFAHGRGLYVNYDPMLKREYYRTYQHIEDAVNDGYIKESDSEYILDQSHKKIQFAMTNLANLFNYMREIADSGFAEELEEELDYPITQAYKRKGFWEEYLQASFYKMPPK